MKYDNFIKTIVESKIEDWIYDDETGRYVFKNDINITMQQDRESDEEFYADWIEKFEHTKAAVMKIYLYYNGNSIDTFYTVAVDESRMYIPIPKSSDVTITHEQYKIGRIVNVKNCEVIDRYDEYVKQAGMKVSGKEEIKCRMSIC